MTNDKEYMRAWHRAHPGKQREYQKRWELKYPGRKKAMQRIADLKHQYGLSHDEFKVMLQSQDGLCAICRVSPATHVDHNHSSDHVREILCNGCNAGIGMFKERPKFLIAAAEYLERHSAVEKGLAIWKGK